MVRVAKFAVLLILLLGAAGFLHDHVRSEIARGIVRVVAAWTFFFWLDKVFSDDEIPSIL
jgi:hypothetical protein